LNAQWGDLLLPLLALSVTLHRPGSPWFRSRDWPLAFYLLVTLSTAAFSADLTTGLGQLAKQVSVALIFLVFRQLTDEAPLVRRLAQAFVASLAAVTL